MNTKRTDHFITVHHNDGSLYKNIERLAKKRFWKEIETKCIRMNDPILHERESIDDPLKQGYSYSTYRFSYIISQYAHA